MRVRVGWFEEIKMLDFAKKEKITPDGILSASSDRYCIVDHILTSYILPRNIHTSVLYLYTYCALCMLGTEQPRASVFVTRARATSK